MRYAFYISGNSTRLLHYLEQSDDAAADQIILVISDYSISDKIEKVLRKNHIKSVEFAYDDFEGISNREKNMMLSDHILEQLEKYNIDYCISFGSHILSGELLEKYKYRLINFHPSILPMFPGKGAIDQAVLHGNTFLVGNTVHFIDSGVDTGKIIMQSVIPLQSFYDNDNDYDCVLDLQIEMLNRLFSIIEHEQLLVEEGNVKIAGADYGKYTIFPEIDIKMKEKDKK